MPTHIDLLRHGQVDGPPALYGKTDVGLSQTGWQQMLRQGKRLQSLDNVISSPLRRCRDFAEDFANQRNLPVQVYCGLQECNFGDWDGLLFDDQSQQWPSMTAFWQDPINNTPPQGESLECFHHRVVTAWQLLCDNVAGQSTLVLCHGGVIRQILAHILPVDWHAGSWYSQCNIGHASLTRITIPAYVNAQPGVNFIGLPFDFD